MLELLRDVEKTRDLKGSFKIEKTHSYSVVAHFNLPHSFKNCLLGVSGVPGLFKHWASKALPGGSPSQ